MKNIFILLLALSIFTSCKNETNTAENETETSETSVAETKNDGLTLITGEFLYLNDAAVLQVGNSIYGVVVDDKMHELYKMGETFRKEPTDGVIVEIRGKILPKPADVEGWDYRIEVKKIISVKAQDPKANEVIKIGQ